MPPKTRQTKRKLSFTGSKSPTNPKKPSIKNNTAVPPPPTSDQPVKPNAPPIIPGDPAASQSAPIATKASTATKFLVTWQVYLGKKQLLQKAKMWSLGEFDFEIFRKDAAWSANIYDFCQDSHGVHLTRSCATIIVNGENSGVTTDLFDAGDWEDVEGIVTAWHGLKKEDIRVDIRMKYSNDAESESEDDQPFSLPVNPATSLNTGYPAPQFFQQPGYPFPCPFQHLPPPVVSRATPCPSESEVDPEELVMEFMDWFHAKAPGAIHDFDSTLQAMQEGGYELEEIRTLPVKLWKNMGIPAELGTRLSKEAPVFKRERRKRAGIV